MIRYVHIGSQILSDRNQFALYDTVTDQFLTFFGTDVFDSVEDLDESMKLDDVRTEMRERCLSLCRHHDNPRSDLEIAKALWALLDDVSTLDDACRDNDLAFRVAVRRVAERRGLYGASFDGQTICLVGTPEWDEGVRRERNAPQEAARPVSE